jgi:genome maintenance exonuclease 1
MAKHIIEHGLKNVNEVWGVEVGLYYPGLYAGTTDCVGLHLNEGAIMDHKQSNKPKKEEWIEDYKLQLVAYALAHNEVYGTKIRKGVVLMCVKPECDDMGNPITEPQYQEFVLKEADFDYWEQQWWKRLELYYMTS